MRSVLAVLTVMLVAVFAKQGSGEKERSNLNIIDSKSSFRGSKRISRGVSESDISLDKDGKGDVASTFDIEDQFNRLGADDEDLRTFYGTHPQQFEQLMDVLAIKGQVKQKAASCTFRDICNHWSNKSFVTKHVDHVRKMLQMFAIQKNTLAGAMANGWLQENCTKIYDACGSFIRVETSLDGTHAPAVDASTTAAPDLSRVSENASTSPPSV